MILVEILEDLAVEAAVLCLASAAVIGLLTTWALLRVWRWEDGA